MGKFKAEGEAVGCYNNRGCCGRWKKMPAKRQGRRKVLVTGKRNGTTCDNTT
ncbi:hypothetical protein AA0483_0322 [Acetobacter syzygii NRIC 0483]|nr:hypothetical protein AA0483_0322 [Acetobacter syzygii NRIC 0483]